MHSKVNVSVLHQTVSDNQLGDGIFYKAPFSTFLKCFLSVQLYESVLSQPLLLRKRNFHFLYWYFSSPWKLISTFWSRKRQLISTCFQERKLYDHSPTYKRHLHNEYVTWRQNVIRYSTKINLNLFWVNTQLYIIMFQIVLTDSQLKIKVF